MVRAQEVTPPVLRGGSPLIGIRNQYVYVATHSRLATSQKAAAFTLSKPFGQSFGILYNSAPVLLVHQSATKSHVA